MGGFFGLEPHAPPRPPPVFDTSDVLSFWNARSALRHLLDTLKARRLWLPAYVCVEVSDAAAGAVGDMRFYGVGADLVPDTELLAAELRKEDAVLGVDYFGTQAEAFPLLARRFPEVAWIQDRAQALWPVSDPWGDYLLYSPRKVMGAPDGGVLVSRRGAVAPPHWAEDDAAPRLAPSRMRADDPRGLRNGVWFPAYQAAEAAMTAAPRPMSRVSRDVVQGADTTAMARRRRRNAAMLLDGLGDRAALPAGRLLAAAPLGVPVLTDDAAAAAARMAGAGVFCARHWARLPSPAADFPAEHDLSRRLLTLPCDHRYGARDMLRVLEAFQAGA